MRIITHNTRYPRLIADFFWTLKTEDGGMNVPIVNTPKGVTIATLSKQFEMIFSKILENNPELRKKLRQSKDCPKIVIEDKR